MKEDCEHLLVKEWKDVNTMEVVHTCQKCWAERRRSSVYERAGKSWKDIPWEVRKK